MNIEPIEEKWSAFGWNTARVKDGHNIESICTELDRSAAAAADKPGCIIVDTIKGKGVSFIENTYKYHNYAFSREEYEKTVLELTDKIDKGIIE